MIQISKFMLMAGVALMTGLSVQAEEKVLQLSLLPDFQLVDKEADIRGIRLGLMTANRNVASTELGFVNITTGDYTGAGFGLINITKGDALGLHMATVNYAGSSAGLQIGFVNRAGVNKGIQVGVFNNTGKNELFQLGLVNMAANEGGIQVGLLNLDRSPNATVPAMVFVNGVF